MVIVTAVFCPPTATTLKTSQRGGLQCTAGVALGPLHTHRLFAGVGSGSGRGVFHTYRHYGCRRWVSYRLRYLKQSSGTDRFRYVCKLQRSTLKLISRTKMFVRRPACRVPVRHANLPGRQLGRTGCVWKHPFIYIASGDGVGPGSGFAGVCANALRLRVQYSLPDDERKMFETCRRQGELN